MTVEPVQLYGHKLYLLSPPELDEEDGKAVGHYNYLDENSGERWCLNAKDGWFGCGKIIGSCYYSTIAAVHILTTLWSASYAATLINGCLVGKDLYQMDQLCAGHTIYEPAGNTAVEIGKLLQLDDDYWAHCNPDLGHLLEDYPPECADRDQTLSCLAAYHFDELCQHPPALTDEDWEELKQSKMLTIQAIYD